MIAENLIGRKSICRKIIYQEIHRRWPRPFSSFFLRSDRRASGVKDHHCGRGSEATGGRGGRKVTHAWKKRSDRRVSREKDHHCRGGSEATGGRRRRKVTHAWKKQSDRAVLRAGGHSYRRNGCVQKASGWMY